MNQIYDTSTKGKYQMLIGKTGKMYKTGKTPDEISLDIKQPVEKVNNSFTSHLTEGVQQEPTVNVPTNSEPQKSPQKNGPTR